MNTTNHFFSILDFKGQKLKNRLDAVMDFEPNVLNSEGFFDDLICYFHNPELISANAFYDYDVTTLISYLKVCHDEYLNVQIPTILSTLNEVIKLGVNDDSFLIQAPRLFSQFFEDLTHHIDVEETKLFPFASLIVENKLSNENSYSTLQFEKDHKSNHIEISDLLIFIGQYKHKFTANFAFTLLEKRLVEFKQDMDLHELLEDEVLIPKLKALELQNLK